MWLESEKFREIDSAVVKGERHGLSRLLSELFHPENQKYSAKMTVCPKCQKPLVRKMHPYLEYFVQACPDRHGVWMSPEVSDKLKQLVSEQMRIATQKKQALRFLIGAVAGMILFSVLTHGIKWLRFSPDAQNLRISENYWPERDFSTLPSLSIKGSVIQDSADLLYLSQVLKLLENGASNRLNMEAVLQTHRSEEKYWKAFEVYQREHAEFLAKLRMLSAPAPLQAFHSKLETSAQAQLEFYAALIQEKVENRSTALQDMLDHPALKVCHRELLSAFDLIQQAYPNLDPPTRQAIESRLCWFDVI